MTTYPFVQAKGYHANRRGTVTWIALHTTESDIGPVGPGDRGAENTANYFATNSNTSAHYVVDDDSTVQCVSEKDEAWTNGPWNAYTITIEQEGRAAFNNWTTVHNGLLNQTALLLADLSTRYDIALKFIKGSDIVAAIQGKQSWPKGVTTHVELNNASRALGKDFFINLGFVSSATNFLDLTSHTDPGVNYPMDEVLRRARSYLPDNTKQEDDMNPFSMRPLGYANQFVICSAGVLVASGELLAKLGIDPNEAVVYKHRQTLLSQMKLTGLTPADMVGVGGEPVPQEHQL